MMHGFGGFGGAGMGAFGWIGMILGLVIIVAVIVVGVLLVILLVRRLGTGAHVSSSPVVPNQSAKDIASARYARGEITREEYQQILSDLSH